MTDFAVKSLAIFVFAVIFSSRVEASCGDYLHTRGSKPSANTVVRMVEIEADPSHETGLDEAAALPMMPPCSGPNCRQRRDREDHRLPAISSSVVDSDGMEDGDSAYQTPRYVERRPRSENESPSRGYPPSTDRPPEFTPAD